jgi:hypothetical protein
MSESPESAGPRPTPTPVVAMANVWTFEPSADAVLTLPNRCANCGDPGGASVRLQPPFAKPWRPVLAPHCARCAQRFEQRKTRHILAAAAGFLVGLVLLLGLPLARPTLGMVSYCTLATLGSAVPFGVAWWFARRVVSEPGQSDAEVAIWWDKRGLRGTNREWFEELAALNRGAAQGSAKVRPLVWAAFIVPATFLAVGPTAFQWLFPTVTVLNLSPIDFELVVDGRSYGVVGVTSLESTSAGKRVALGAGSHILEARPTDGEGSETYRVEVDVEAGEEYLFAPGATGYCFWLERTVYGARDGKSHVHPLGGKDGFFRLPSVVDTWFAPNPEPNSDRRSSGGEMVAVRHGRCAEVPSPSNLPR